ncbi:leucine aminopeptidase 2, chloroplastic [Artemisia annua]|uniref:Leucine aminopeptidase 2, chloroplastic n=1 Tax=Artemisia annua TaxID=35608 RepID=A0A2U1LX00_ARTAN|nr:leucine aminopeptidase 2, chloroplastic [Artemisia annua]
MARRHGWELPAHTFQTTVLFSYKNGNSISLSAKDINLVEWQGDILAVGVTENDMSKDENSKLQNPALKKLDSRLSGLLSEVTIEEDFTGKAGQSIVIRLSGLGFKRISLIGLGKGPTGSSTYAYHSLGESVASAAKASQANNVAIALASSEGLNPASKLVASAIAKGTLLGTYEDNRFKSEFKKSTLKSVDLIGLGVGPEVEKKLKYTAEVCTGVILAKELINAPANAVTPEVLAEEAEKIAAAYGDLFTATIVDTEQCKELKMGSYLGVPAASANPPKFIHLCYKPLSGPIKTKLALVGKGLTYDSGGYNIKTVPGSMELMKFDMGGSAAVLGAAKALGQIKPGGVEVHFIVAACENMISGSGMRPGDILTASNGKTIEVNNTDAEGRLTLADALVYACNQGVDKIVDLATLTAACRVALGHSIAAILTSSDELFKEMVAASEVAGEKFWRLPMEESYWESMNSGVADMVNTGPMIVDLATLTAACRVALGHSIAGKWIHVPNYVFLCVWNYLIFVLFINITAILTSSDELFKEMVAASEVAGEKFWRLPMEESYWESMNSGVADMVNTGPSQGGIITAALFLQQFVDEKVQWLHIDMAGPVWNHKKKAANRFGVSTLVEWVVSNSSS